MPAKKPDNPMDRRIAIMELFDSGGFLGPCTVTELVQRVGGTTAGVTRALRDLDFEIVRKESQRREKPGTGKKAKLVKVPRQWGRPKEWPAVRAKERQLRGQGASVGFAKSIFHSADVPMGVFDQALVILVKEGIPVNRRGALKKAINTVLAEREEHYNRNVISVKELAEVLRESPDMPKQALLNRAAGLLRAATRKS